uniref:Uncharacterized protein n=1 Tax=Glossina brevipalpis TaxID=37001 RepID=A0A1A9X5J2_9MUSC
MGIMYKLMKQRKELKIENRRMLTMDGNIIEHPDTAAANEMEDKHFTAEHILQLCKFLAEKSKTNKNLHKQQQTPKNKDFYHIPANTNQSCCRSLHQHHQGGKHGDILLKIRHQIFERKRLREQHFVMPLDNTAQLTNLLIQQNTLDYALQAISLITKDII